MTPAESFKLGFLLRCADEGCAPSEVQMRVKMANSILDRIIRAGVAASPLLGYWLTSPLHLQGLGMLGGAGLGAGVGYGLARLQNSDVDVDDAKRNELIEAYRQQAERTRQRLRRRLSESKSPRTPQLF